MNDNQLENRESKELLRKAEVINDAFTKEKKAGIIESLSTEVKDKKIEKMLADIPREELREEVRELIQIIQESSRDDKTKLNQSEKACKHILMSYMDGREYLRMPNREFIEYRIYRSITEILENKKLGREDLYKVARINFDLNGLKVMNDVGGHGAGNLGLKIFASIIKEGETTRWLNTQGIQTAASAEGGDEFGLVIYGDKDLRPILQEIEERYFHEVRDARTVKTLKITTELDENTGKKKIKMKSEISNVDDIFDFTDPKIIHKLETMGIANNTDKKVPEVFQFQMGTSVGSATFGEALQVVGFEGVKTYKEMMDRIINQMFKMADHRAIIQKDETKKALETSNPTLFRMYTRVSPEVVVLNTKIVELAKKIEEMQATNEEERRKREEAEREIIRLKTELLKAEMQK